MIDVRRVRAFRSAVQLARLLRSKAVRGPILIVLYGPSHAGKSTFARSLGPGYRVVSSDAIRCQYRGLFEPSEVEKRVWKVFEAMKRYHFRRGCSVVMDACHLSQEARAHALEDVPAGYWRICVRFDVSWAVARARCLRSGRLPVSEVRRMWRVFRSGRPAVHALRQAGFDEVYVLSVSR